MLNLPPDSSGNFTCPRMMLAYAPAGNEEAGKIMEQTRRRLPCLVKGNEPFKNDAMLEKNLTSSSKAEDVYLCGVVFENTTESVTNYKLRDVHHKILIC